MPMFAFRTCLVAAMLFLLVASCLADDPALWIYLDRPASRMMAYTPSQLDPRNPANHDLLKSSSIEADLRVLRPLFDGLILYGYHEADTPRIVYAAHKQGFKSVLLGIWNPRSAEEVDGVAALARQYGREMAIGILVGNEGLHFGRYEVTDVEFAAARLRSQLGKDIPLSTSEPHARYEDEFVLKFGEFLAPNIHPVFDSPDLAAAEAAEWTHKNASALHARTGKRILVKETGFPHAGQPKFTPQSQQEFWRSYLSAPEQPGVFHRVAFEAFDLPWKSEASGLEIEKSWGWFSSDRKPLPVCDVLKP